MGKYMRKAKTTGDVALMDASQPSLGVRTRAKTLALQSKPDSCYLELRSRRLEKQPPVKKRGVNSQNTPPVVPEEEKKEIGAEDMEIDEASFGENNLELEARASRGTRESTPCSLIKTSDDITAPGSSTKRRVPVVATERAQNAVVTRLTTNGMEEFFAQVEQTQQRLFMEKYNFDVVNDKPLPGRYEWIKVVP